MNVHTPYVSDLLVKIFSIRSMLFLLETFGGSQYLEREFHNLRLHTYFI